MCLSIYDILECIVDLFSSGFHKCHHWIMLLNCLVQRVLFTSQKWHKHRFVGECWKLIAETDDIFTGFLFERWKLWGLQFKSKRYETQIAKIVQCELEVGFFIHKLSSNFSKILWKVNIREVLAIKEIQFGVAIPACHFGNCFHLLHISFLYYFSTRMSLSH